jgi:hypothetical protein
MAFMTADMVSTWSAHTARSARFLPLSEAATATKGHGDGQRRKHKLKK